MSTETPPPPVGRERQRRAAADNASWRSVALPTEHGGWSLTAEPALLGLLVAWSAPGLALGVAAVLAFVARTPLKLVLVDVWRRRWLIRTTRAAVVAAVELVLLAVLVTVAVRDGESGFWVPLAVAAPLVVLELWYDMRSRSRRLVPELAGAIGIGSVAAAIALAGGEATGIAWGLWLVMAARSVAAIPFVRAEIQRVRNHSVDRRTSDVAQGLAVAATAVAWIADLLPAASVVIMAVVAGWHLIGSRRPPRRVVVIGITQMVIGLAVITVTAVALRLG